MCKVQHQAHSMHSINVYYYPSDRTFSYLVLNTQGDFSFILSTQKGSPLFFCSPHISKGTFQIDSDIWMAPSGIVQHGSTILKFWQPPPPGLWWSEDKDDQKTQETEKYFGNYESTIQWSLYLWIYILLKSLSETRVCWPDYCPDRKEFLASMIHGHQEMD